MLRRFVLCLVSLLTIAAAATAQSGTVVIRPKEIDAVLVNPGMGIQTFQRFNGDAINPEIGRASCRERV